MTKEVRSVLLSIRRLNKKLEGIRLSCPHANTEEILRSDTGNWCPSDDSYWSEFYCRDCLKMWSGDQRSFKGAKVVKTFTKEAL